MLSQHQQDLDDNQTDSLHSPPSAITIASHAPKSAHPLDLPEIRTRIGYFLTSKGLACCARVSREWHASFHPLLWADVHIPESCTSPTVQTLQKNARLIKSLRAVACRSNSTYFTLKGCVNLSQLYIRTRSRFWSMSAMAEVPEMIQEHSRSLQELELDAYEFEPSTLMWEAIGRCSCLKTLTLHNIKVSPENLQPFLLACTRVSVLHLLNPTLPDATLPYTSGPELKGVQDLRLHEVHNAESERQLLFMKLCPNITSLYWRRSGFTITFPIRQVTSSLAAGRWPNLHSLELFGDIMEDEDLAGLVKFIPRLESWRTPKTGFGPVALEAMECHFLTIREIDLRACESLTSPMIQHLLYSIPTLEYFSADRLCADDILQDPVWPCSPRLKTLKLFIDMGVSKDVTSDEFKAQQMAVFDRLSMLRGLTVLQVSRNVAGPLRPPAMRALRLQLSAGMTRLDKLRQLEELWFIPGQVMEEGDVEWILKSFPRLSSMSFYMHSNYDKNEQLLKTMKTWGKSEVVRPKLLSSSSDRAKA